MTILIRLLESRFLISLRKILFGVHYSIHEDAVFRSLVIGPSTVVSSLSASRTSPPDPVFVRYPGSDATASSITYIVCLNGRVPERYEVWSLNAHVVREVHTTARVKIFDLFAEDTFWSTLFNSRRCRVPFIGRRSVNGSIKFIRFADVI